MSIFRTALKSGLAVKAARIAQREMRKPENQRKAKQLLARLTNRRQGPAPSR